MQPCVVVFTSKSFREFGCSDGCSVSIFRFPRSLVLVIIDGLEKLYIAGFPLLLAFITLFPVLTQRPNSKMDVYVSSEEFSWVETTGSAMEFLPLMLTSVYCAVGLVWGFLRLMFIYLNEETTYQGQLSGLG